jgi:hypothetical protein
MRWFGANLPVRRKAFHLRSTSSSIRSTTGRRTKSGFSRTIQSHSAHEIKRVTIWYRWHPFYGQTVRMLRARNKDGDQCIRCELPDGTTATIPAWMTDAETCAQMSAGEPAIGLAALVELRSFLDSRLRDRPIDAGIAGSQPSVGSDPQPARESESRWEDPE